MIKIKKFKKAIVVSSLMLSFSLGATYASTPYYIQADLTAASNSDNNAPSWGLSSDQLNQVNAYWGYVMNHVDEKYIAEINIPHGNIGPGVVMLCVAGEHVQEDQNPGSCSDVWTGDDPNATPFNISTDDSSPTFSFMVVAQSVNAVSPDTEAGYSYNYSPLIIDRQASDLSCQSFITSADNNDFAQIYHVSQNQEQTNLVFSANTHIVPYQGDNGHQTYAAVLSNCSLTPEH